MSTSEQRRLQEFVSGVDRMVAEAAGSREIGGVGPEAALAAQVWVQESRLDLMDEIARRLQGLRDHGQSPELVAGLDAALAVVKDCRDGALQDLSAVIDEGLAQARRIHAQRTGD
jgi:hypothetical protein